MDRTFPLELNVTDIENIDDPTTITASGWNTINQIRLRVGDPKVPSRELIPNISVEYSDPRIMSDGCTYWNPESKFWPVSIKVNDITYSGTVVSGTAISDPSIVNYRYLIFNESLIGKKLDLWLELFSISDAEIWYIFRRAPQRVREQLVIPNMCTDNMSFLQACVDCMDLIRSMKLTTLYSMMRMTDGDTHFIRQLTSGMDPLKDQREAILRELNVNIRHCNTVPYRGGIRVE